MPGKPVGLVHFAAASRGGRLRHVARQFGDIGRGQVRCESVAQALAMLRALAEQEAASP
jgi:nicotinamide-nucleotide amidase